MREFISMSVFALAVSTSALCTPAPNDPAEFLRQAQALRDEAAQIKSTLPKSTLPTSRDPVPQSYTHQIDLDFGREENTWMDPAWGRSGGRLRCTLDVSFAEPPLLEPAAIRLRGEICF